ncbi:flagellar hook-associated protein 1 [Shouchella clausii]|nr:flagellar hook-associated protein 1 [Shouchella clausii]
MSTFFGMETMRRAVNTNRTAIQTVGNNVANVNTPGYSRQRVNLQATGGYPATGVWTQPAMNGRIGSGVQVTGIERIRDQLLDRQFRSEAHVEGAAFIQYKILERMEDLYNEAPSDTTTSRLSDQFASFWNGWKELASGKESQAVLLEQGKAVTDAFTHLQHSFQTEMDMLETEAELTTAKVNQILEQLHATNKDIIAAESSGQVPNELYDGQDRLLDQLSSLVPIQVSRSPKPHEHAATGAEGPYKVELKLGGSETITLVDATEEGPQLLTLQDGMQWTVGDSNQPFTYSGAGGGELVGLQKAHERVGQELEDIKVLAQTFAKEVNQIYAFAYSEQGGFGQEFFTIHLDDSGAFSHITVNSELSNNPKALATARFNEEGIKPEYQDEFAEKWAAWENDKDNEEAFRDLLTFLNEADHYIDGKMIVEGNVDVAKEISRLEDSAAIIGKYQDMMGKLGVETKAQRDQTEASNARLANTESNRMSISGVSLDEEMSLLIQFQHAYNAAARAMTAMDEMLDQIINRLGVVGR